MNESIHDQLDAIVGCAIRPVSASASRKRMIREELLAHVTAVFDEELARLGDEQAAVNETARRFGIAAELESQLQASVPWLDRFFLISEREILMSRWFWLAAVFAVFFGPAMLLPALAKFRDHGELLWVPMAIGLLITFAGLGGIGYGVMQRFVRSA